MNLVTADFLLEIYDASTSTWTDYTGYMRVGSLQIEHTLNSPSVMSFSLYDDEGTMPQAMIGQRVRISDVKDGNRTYYFGGQIHRFDKRQISPGNPYTYEVSCQDWGSILDRFYVTAAYEDQYSGYIIKDLIAQMPSGDQLDTTNVVDGPKVGVMNVPSITIKEALDDLARTTGYKMWISHDRKLYWQSKEADPSDASRWTWDLDCTNALTNVLGVPIVTRDRSQYRNVQEVRGGSQADDAYDFFPPVGVEGMPAEWTYNYSSPPLEEVGWQGPWDPPVLDLGKPINEVMFAYVSDIPTGMLPGDKTRGQSFTVGPKGSKTLFYYIVGDRHLYVNKEYESAGQSSIFYAWDPLPIGKKMYVWCDVKFQGGGAAIVSKNDAWCKENGVDPTDTIEDMQAIEGGSGEYRKLEIDERLMTMEACMERAVALIKEYGTIPTVVQYTSDDWGDLEVGKWQMVTIYDLNKACMVRSVRITDVSGKWLRAEIELVGSEKVGFAQYWRAISGGSTAKMQSTYAVRAEAQPTEFIWPPEQTVYVVDADLTYTELDAATVSKWGGGSIGEGAEWA